MNPRLKSILAVVAGIVSGAVVISVVEMLSPYRPPEGLDFNDKAKIAEWVQTLPVSAFGILLLGYFLGSVAGGWVTNRIASSTPYRPALVTGFGMFAAGLMNLIAIPHPLWFTVGSSLLYFAGAWIGGRMVKPGPPV